jgi:hypothetical protein
MSTDSDESVDAELNRDVEYITARVEHEGISFLTISLPAFAKDFERSLELGQVSDGSFVGFSRIRRGAKLPSYLRWFTRLVFDSQNGRLLDGPNPEAIRAVRQLAGLFGKIALPCTPARNAIALEKFIECENEVGVTDRRLLDDVSLSMRHRRVAGLLFGGVLSDLDQMIHEYKLTPGHGPGATADRFLGNKKWTQREWPVRLEAVFPAMDYLLPSPRFYKETDEINFVEPENERPVKVILVPKTLKTPRVIAVEPTCMQYMQQAIAVHLVQCLERSSVRGMIGFTDQVPNQDMARWGSLSGELATLDLSEASDRVSNLLVQSMLERHPQTNEGVQACRSTRADVPGHGIIPLSKFASMGSALCFPIEAMVFLAVVFVGIEDALSRPLTARDIQSFNGRVRVYGDDIIIPAEFVHSVIGALEAFGLKVNQGKSFWTGRFRESCGKEYFGGHDVSIVKVRQLLPSSRTDTQEIISAVSLRNLCYSNGLWGTTRWLDEQLGKVIRHYPTVGKASPLLGRHSLLADKLSVRRFCRYTHVALERGYRVRAPLPVNEIDGSAALLKWFTKRSEDPFASPDHLTRSGRPQVVDIKLGIGPVL